MAGLNSASFASGAPQPPHPGRRPTAADLIRRLEQPQTYLWMMAAIMLLVLVWALLTSVDKVVRVEGRIIPAGRSQSIQHLEGGIVAAINVQEGAVIHKGEVLLSIDDTSAQASLAESKNKLLGLRIKAVRLEAEAKGQSSMNVADSLRQNRELVDAELHLFAARRQKLDQERRIFEEQISQRNSELREIQSRHRKLSVEMETARQRLKLMASMATRNAASQLEVLEAQSREQRLLTELSDAENAQPKVAGAIAEAQARIQDSSARYRAEAQGELSSTMVEVDRLENTITTQADRATRTEVRAPVDGIINRITINTVGGVLKPGDTIVEITPSTQDIVLEARARPSDRGDLRAGLPAKVRVSAYDVGELGILAGQVTEVSADTVQDAKGEPFYRVVILVDRLPESYAGKQIVPGMTITADVVTGSRTIMQYVTAPFTRFIFNAFRDAR
ncbi:MAG: HlyD family type I secretion periplasmic adaptor subunit [Magnetospirillum sp.]|nr:HlyD family type I secretion periplasmic adaptor subunit [Magnetospirillum sp.]